MTSAAYRQSSAPPRAGIPAADAANRLLWRQRSRRLEAEAVRDAVLAAAGTLDPTLYGEPVPLETRPTGEVAAAGEEGRGRRSLYLLVRRTQPVNLLNVFDAPVMETNCTRRTSSTTVSQSLALLNSRFLAAQAAHFARRVLKERPPERGIAATLDRACELTLARPPTPAERAFMLAFLQVRADQEERCREGGEPGGSPAGARAERAWADLCHALLGANEFLYVD